MIATWTAFAYLSGACLFSYWLGRIVRTNLQNVGDGNPGALNLWQAAGYRLGLAGVVLDFMKGYLPVLLYLENGGGSLETYGLFFVAIAPIAGHAFSPFLRFRGGKAIAVTFGAWSAVTGFEASLAYAIILALLLLAGRAMNRGQSVSTSADGFQVVGGLLLLSVFLVARQYPAPVLGFWLANFALLAYTHRRELRDFVASKG